LSYILFIGEDITAVKAVVHGIIVGLPIPFPIPNADGCKNSNLVCPLKSGQTYFYRDAIPVAAIYPSVSIPIFYAWQ
jgi:Niemann-Pick C2 protein